jgi:hypothetical protein
MPNASVTDRFIAGGSIVASGTVPELMESVSHGHTIRLAADTIWSRFAEELQVHFSGCTVETGTDHAVTLISEKGLRSLQSCNTLMVRESPFLRPRSCGLLWKMFLSR